MESADLLFGSFSDSDVRLKHQNGFENISAECLEFNALHWNFFVFRQCLCKDCQEQIPLVKINVIVHIALFHDSTRDHDGHVDVEGGLGLSVELVAPNKVDFLWRQKGEGNLISSLSEWQTCGNVRHSTTLRLAWK